MGRIVSNLCLVALVAFNAAQVRANCIGRESSVELLSNNYGGDLMRYNSERFKHPNSMFSPLSVANMIAQLRQGSTGNTKAEFDNVGRNNLFGYFPDKKQIPGLYKASRRVLKEYKLAVFVDDSIYLLPDFVNISSNFYSTEFQTVDFSLSNVSLATINTWAQESSVGMVTRTLFAPNKFTANIRMVAVNTLDFKLNLPFVTDPLDKVLRTFYYKNGTQVEVAMQSMYADGFYNHTQSNVQTPSVFFVNLSATEDLYIFMENDFTSIHTMEHEFCAKYKYWMSLANNQRFILYFPAFMNEYRMDVKALHLHRSGAVHAFASTAEYGDMTNSTKAYYSEAVHQVSLEVGKKQPQEIVAPYPPPSPDKADADCEIPSNCELFCEPIAPPPDQLHAVLNRPYLFIVRNSQTKAILLYGQVKRP